jgi:hypothetical protein
MNTAKFLLFAVLLSFVTSNAGAATDLDDSEMIGYEQILKELSGTQQNTTRGSARAAEDPFANIMIHGGIGMVSTFGQAHVPDGTIQYSGHGIQATLGIDLFSPNWLAEFSARSFARSEYENAQMALREFDTKFLYRDLVSKGIGFRFGAGVAARYMTVDMAGTHTEFTTPASIIGGGLDLNFSKNVSAGLDVSSRNSLVAETGDRSSVDATLRMDAHF